MVYPFCFPVIYHGLFAGHVRIDKDYKAVNILLAKKEQSTDNLLIARTNSNGDEQNYRRIPAYEISTYLSGKKPVSPIRKDDALEASDEMENRVKSLGFSDIEIVVSAFHLLVTTCSTLNKEEIARFENIIMEDNNPYKYISEAVLLSIQYPTETVDIVQQQKEILHKLYLADKAYNLFRLNTNERVHYLIERGVPEYITDEVLLDFWRKMRQTEMTHPGRVSLKTFSLFEKMTCKEARALLLASETFLCLDYSRYIMLDTSKFEIDTLSAWLFSSQEVLAILIESGLLRSGVSQKNFYVKERVLSNRNKKLYICFPRTSFSIFEYLTLDIFELTEAGNDLVDILDLKANDDYLRCVVCTLSNEFKDRKRFSALPLSNGKGNYYNPFHPTYSLVNYPIDEVLLKAKYAAFPHFMYILTGNNSFTIADYIYQMELLKIDQESDRLINETINHYLKK